MRLKCCSKEIHIEEEIILFDTSEKTHQILIVGTCKNPKCLAKVAELTWFDVKKSKFQYFKPKKKDVEKFINICKKYRYMDTPLKNIKQGTKANLYWKYQKNGNIYDLNNTLIEKRIKI